MQLKTKNATLQPKATRIKICVILNEIRHLDGTNPSTMDEITM